MSASEIAGRRCTFFSRNVAPAGIVGEDGREEDEEVYVNEDSQYQAIYKEGEENIKSCMTGSYIYFCLLWLRFSHITYIENVNVK